MNKRTVPSIILASACVVMTGMATPVRADVKLTSHMTMSSPQMKMDKMPPAAKAMMERMMTTTMSFSGKKSRIDMAMISIITDHTADTMITANNMSHTYSVSKIDAAKASKMMSSGPGRSAAHGEKKDIKVTDTGKTSVVLGHTCHEYLVTATIDDGNGGTSNFSDDILAATDLSGIDTAGFNPFSSTAGTTGIAGIPLVNTITMTGGKADGTTMKTEVTAISTDDLPATTFEAPSGYTLVDDASSMMPGMAGMMGAFGH